MICRILNISKDNNNGLMNIKYSLKYLVIILYGILFKKYKQNHLITLWNLIQLENYLILNK